MKAFETIQVGETVKALNAEIYKHGLEKAVKATIDVQVAGIKYRVDGGLPSSTLGMSANAGDIVELEGFNDIQFFRAIRNTVAPGGSPSMSLGTDAILNIDYT